MTNDLLANQLDPFTLVLRAGKFKDVKFGIHEHNNRYPCPQQHRPRLVVTEPWGEGLRRTTAYVPRLEDFGMEDVLVFDVKLPRERMVRREWGRPVRLEESPEERMARLYDLMMVGEGIGAVRVPKSIQQLLESGWVRRPSRRDRWANWYRGQRGLNVRLTLICLTIAPWVVVLLRFLHLV